jgi:hypothetical protein
VRVTPLEKGAAMTEPKTYALEVPGAVLHYDVRAGDGSTWPVLLIIGSPMGALRIRRAGRALRGFGPAMAKFLTLVSLEGPVPEGYADRPAPDPAAFGLPAQDDGSRDDALLGLNMISLSQYQHDFTALLAVPTRIVAGVGAQSGQMLAGRGAVAVAEQLGTTPVTFPGGHGGFLPSGGPYGGEPDAFAGILRMVLSG